MANEGLSNIKEAAEEFFSKNQADFEILETFEDQIVDLTKDSFQEIIQLVKDNQNVFFKDHSSIISFLNIIERALVFNFQKFEIILDIVLNFPTEIRSNNVTDSEILDILDCYQISHNYLFAHGFFTIETITKHSYFNDFFFIKFLPEIEQYDSEYAKIRESRLNIRTSSSKLQELYKLVKTDPNRHIINRTTYYHPSALHKCIRDDDIDTFQSLLSKNNFSVNYQIPFSYYERAQTIDSNLSLIQVAATYSSLKIFKFLWMQNDIQIPANLLQYAFFGRNSEIIHLCENKTSHDKVILQAMFMNRLDLLDYYLENFAEIHIEKNSFVSEKLNEFSKSEGKNDDLYDLLTFDDLSTALNYFIITILKSCMPKIVFLFQKVDCSSERETSNFLITSSLIHFKLFEFLYSQKVADFEQTDCFYRCLRNSIRLSANDTFKFLFSKSQKFEIIRDIFIECLNYNLDLAKFLLDLQIESPTNKILKSNLIDIIDAVLFCYDEDIIVKMIKINSGLFNANGNVNTLVLQLLKVASTKMLMSLFDKIVEVLPKEVLLKFATAFESYNLNVANHIKSKLDE